MKSSEKLPLNIECDPGNDSDSSSSSSSPRLENLQEAEALIQSDLQLAKTNKKSKKKKRQIIFNVSDTKYEVVRYVGKELFQWKLSFESDGRWDVFWTDGAVHPETLARMRSYQKINHFPGMYSLARKNHLGRYLMKMRKAFPEEYKFFPRTFLLPAEYSEFRAQFNKKSHTFIVKPEAGCQGRGIFLTRTFESVEPGEHYVVQKYIEKPFLIDGLKFDLRVYVLLAGCDPLRIYIFEEGLARFATEPYMQPGGKNLGNMCMHLTNYAINKNNPKFVFNTGTSAEENNQGHKRSLKAVLKMLESQGHDVKKLWREIKKLAIKTFCGVQPILAHYYKACQSDDFHNNMCFEVLGFDIMLDEQLKPWLIEVNHTPSFTTDTPLDRNIKMNVIKDTLKLMNISLEAKKKYKKAKRAQYKQRILTGKFVRLTAEERQAEIEKAQKERDEWENQNLGGFEKVFPIEDPSQAEEKYEDFLKEAHRWWGEWTGTSIKRSQKKEAQPTKIPPTGYVRRSTPLRQDNLVRELSATVTQKFRPGDKNNRALSFMSPIRSALMQSGIGSESESKNMDKILTTPRALSTERSGKDGTSFEDKKDEIKNLKKSQLYYSQELGFNQECNEIVGEDYDEEDMKERYRLKVKNIEELEENVLLMEKMQSRPQLERSDEIENNKDQRNSQRYFFRIRSNNGKQGMGEPVVIKVPVAVESKETRGILDPNIEPKTAFQRNQKNFVKLIQQRAASPHLIVGRSFTESTTFNPDLAESINQFMKGNRAAIKRISSIERNPKPREATNTNIITNEFTNKSYVPSRKVNDKPTQKISALFLQPKRPQNQPRSQTASRVVRLNFGVGSDNDETREISQSFAVQGQRTFSSKPEIKERPVKVMSVNLMSNLLYSKERFSNMQKLLDNFLVDDKK